MMWIRYRFYKWLFRSGGPVMIRHNNDWIFVDIYGVIWSVRYTGQREIPLSISCVLK